MELVPALKISGIVPGRKAAPGRPPGPTGTFVGICGGRTVLRSRQPNLPKACDSP
jgi:hypothetical protein